MGRPGEHLTAPLADPAFWAGDPHPLLARLRGEAPVAWLADPGCWVLTGHAEVLAASTDAATFCSGKGILLQDIGAELPEVPGALLYIDPPDHTRYRTLVQPAFAPSRMRALEPALRDRAETLIDAMLADVPAGTPPAAAAVVTDAPRADTALDGPPGAATDPAPVMDLAADAANPTPRGAGHRAVTADVVEALAVPYPLQVIARLLGFPEEDWPRFHRWSDAFIAAADGGVEQSETILADTIEATNYLLDGVADRRATPRDDLVSQLTHTVIDGDALSDDELLMFLGQLLVAGNETTRNLISGGLVALAEHPDQWERLRADRSLVASAVEELLRWSTPVGSFLRTATVDCELGGQAIAAGEPLLLVYASANRDERVFGPTADTLDIARDPNHHLAFGFGTHFCLGAMLARMEGRVLLEVLTDRVAALAPAGPVERVPSTVIAGISRAPLTLTPGP